MLDQTEGQKLVEQVLSLSRADEVQVDLQAVETTHLRFARNTPSTSGRHSDHTLTVRSTFGKKSASATINQLDLASLKLVTERSAELARLAPDNPEYMPELGPQSFAKVSAHDPEVSEHAGARMVEGSAHCIEQARAIGLSAAGFCEAVTRASWLGNRRGLLAQHRSTDVTFSETVRTQGSGGSGWASSVGNRLAQIDYARCSDAAIAKARSSVDPKPLAPGKYVTILEPACVASLMQLLLFSLNARSADEGRSFFSEPGGKTKLNQRLFPSSVSIYSDPSAENAPGVPYADDGLPQLPQRWIEQGVLQNLSCERFWAQKTGREPLPPPSNLIMKGGSGSLADLIASTARGVLITSLWYIRFVDPRTLLLTGLTRDGVFWIEDGKISHPVTNFRWNDSPIAVLKNLDAMTESLRASPRESAATNISVPALRVKEFELSSVSDAV
jgi:predicted Zn-dependent protease